MYGVTRRCTANGERNGNVDDGKGHGDGGSSLFVGRDADGWGLVTALSLSWKTWMGAGVALASPILVGVGRGVLNLMFKSAADRMQFGCNSFVERLLMPVQVVTVRYHDDRELYAALEHWLGTRASLPQHSTIMSRTNKHVARKNRPFSWRWLVPPPRPAEAKHEEERDVPPGERPVPRPAEKDGALSPCPVDYAPEVGSTLIVRYDGYPISVTKAGRTSVHGLLSSEASHGLSFTLSNLGYTHTCIDGLLADALEIHRRALADRVVVTEYSCYTSPLAQSLPARTLDTSYHSPSLVRRLFQDFDAFRHSRAQYERMGIPYTRGYLLHGPPGNGKSTLINLVAAQLGASIYVVTTSSMGAGPSSTFAKAFQSAPPNSVIVIEELDTFFSWDEQKAAACGPTRNMRVSNFGELVSALDGTHAVGDMRIIIATTNHIERLDPALMRTGRMDRVFAVEGPTADQITALFCNFLLVSNAVGSSEGDDDDDDNDGGGGATRTMARIDITRGCFDFENVPTSVVERARAFARRVLQCVAAHGDGRAPLSVSDVQSFIQRCFARPDGCEEEFDAYYQELCERHRPTGAAPAVGNEDGAVSSTAESPRDLFV